MMGNVTIGAAQRGRPIALTRVPDQITITRGPEGAMTVPMNFNRLFFPSGVPVYMDQTDNRFISYGRTLHSLPTVSGADEYVVADAEQRIMAAADTAAVAQENLAKWMHSQAQTELAQAEAGLRRLDSLSVNGIGANVFKRAAKSVQHAVSQGQQAVRATATAVQHAATSTRNAVVHVANQAAAQAVKAGQSVAAATKSAVKAAEKLAHKVAMEAKRAVDKLKLSPRNRVLAYLTALPPPANLVAAYKYTHKHKDEVLRDLPPSVRNFVSKLDTQISEVFEGKRSNVSGFPMALKGMGNIAGTIGGMSWAEAKKRISDAWYHKLSSGTRKALIALLVVLAIITIIVAIYGSPGSLPALFKGEFAVIKVAFTNFINAVGWPAILALLTAIYGWFKGSSGAPQIPPAPGEPGGPPVPPPPTEAEVAATGNEIKAQSGASPAKIGIPIAAAAAALLLL